MFYFVWVLIDYVKSILICTVLCKYCLAHFFVILIVKLKQVKSTILQITYPAPHLRGFLRRDTGSSIMTIDTQSVREIKC